MNKKRIVTAVTCCALVGAIAVGGTIALLTSNAHTLKNTFTIGNNYPENALTLKEHAVERVTDLNAANHTGYTFGDYAQKSENDWVTADNSGTKGNSYTDVIPGSKLDKDPQFTLAKGSPNSWIIAYVDGITEVIAKGITINEVTGGSWYKINVIESGGTVSSASVDSTAAAKEITDGYYLYNDSSSTDAVVNTTSSAVTTTPLFTRLTAGETLRAATGTRLNITIKGVAVQVTSDMTFENSMKSVMQQVITTLGTEAGLTTTP